MTALAPTLQAFFTTRLTSQYGASPHTVAAYRDTWQLLLGYAAQATQTPPVQPGPGPARRGPDQRIPHLPGNPARTTASPPATLDWQRCTRFSPTHRATTPNTWPPSAGSWRSRPNAEPRTEVCYLTNTEVTALLSAPDQTTTAGRRDHAMLQLAVTAGLRVGELTALQVRDVHLGVGAHVLCHGKGRKNRTTPLDRRTVQILKTFTTEQPSDAEGFVFPTRTGTRMSRDAVSARLALHTATAAMSCPSLTTKTSPHTCSGTLRRCDC